jgi:UDP-3-O-[3-hydroxymyristoyl] glucosamine N-acyltransferase
VGAGTILGEGVVLYPHCTVGPDVRIGKGTVLFAGVVIYEGVQIGAQVRIHANTVVGSDGFGYAPIRADLKSKEVTGHQKIYHLGTVVIGDHVEIGSSSTVDRGTFGATRIESHAKLDNQVHVGHNAFVGKGAILCGGICLAGGSIIEDFAYIGGLTGVANRVKIGKQANVAAMTLVTKDVKDGDVVVGNPQRPYREHFKVHALLNRMLENRKS